VSRKVNFVTQFTTAPHFLADIQILDGVDPANIRWKNQSEKSINLWIDEEASLDSEIKHTSEVIGYLAISRSH
jgi:hypothetical protein